MAFREIQFGEVVVVGLDVGTFGDRKAHVGEDRGQFVGHLADRMHAAGFGRRFAYRQSDVDGLGVETGVERGRSKLVFCRRDGRGDAILQSVDCADLAPCARPASWLPSVLSSADTEPLLPSAAMRTASSAASSLAEATPAQNFLLQFRDVRTWLTTVSCAGLTRASSPSWHRARPTGMAGTSPAMTAKVYAGNAAFAFSTIA